MTKKLVSIVLVVLIAIGIVALVKKRKSELAKLPTAKVYPVVVKTIKPKLENFYLSLSGLGLIKSSIDMIITSKLSGRLMYVKNIGDKVKKGEVIARLDVSATKAAISQAISQQKSLKAKLSAATLTLKNLELTHKRTAELLKVKGASIEQFQKEEDQLASVSSQISSLKSQIKATKSNIKHLRILLSYGIIKSPVDGVVSKKFLNTGDVVMPGKPICSISSTGGKYLLLRLPEDIKPQGVIFEGKYHKVIPLHSTFNGLDEYKADIDTTLNTNARVKVGVVIFKGKAIKLPFDAVLSDDGKNYVFIAKGNKSIPKQIKIIASGEEGLAVLDKGLLGKKLILAKPDIFIKLRGGVPIVKE
ncbi:efflux RND transporter periplasmic adaptor subunit [Hippea maritima]|uniref:Efflux transporter, RND family, MFP subunit n=1 Tax=Hippea maritima (strain ATCC 700847 / DSM 10411 / MH2) TaxID=760142 RepID=F2LY55_HIPMA|nr:biotin/lipoyl-binding protein [Hippea maritima]AEA34378.1 efflux transporter, RND family, MFP subunit [Hippea maritima DSM 10411]